MGTDAGVDETPDTKLKNSTVLAGSQGARNERKVRGGQLVRTGADRENHGNGEKAFRDKWAGCVVMRLSTRYGNGGIKKRERCKPVRAWQTDALTGGSTLAGVHGQDTSK